MTRQAETNITCHQCDCDLICTNCKQPQKIGTKYSQWLRLQNELDSNLGYVTTDIDFVWRHHKEKWFIIIEEKVNGCAKSFYSQDETYRIVDELLRNSSEYEYRGFYKIIFSSKSPDDSEWIEINGKRSNSKDELMNLMKTGTLFDW